MGGSPTFTVPDLNLLLINEKQQQPALHDPVLVSAFVKHEAEMSVSALVKHEAEVSVSAFVKHEAEMSVSAFVKHEAEMSVSAFVKHETDMDPSRNTADPAIVNVEPGVCCNL